MVRRDNALNGQGIAGACFDPDGKTLFVNVYGDDEPGATLAIAGPWRRGRGKDRDERDRDDRRQRVGARRPGVSPARPAGSYTFLPADRTVSCPAGTMTLRPLRNSIGEEKTRWLSRVDRCSSAAPR